MKEKEASLRYAIILFTQQQQRVFASELEFHRAGEETNARPWLGLPKAVLYRAMYNSRRVLPKAAPRII